MKAFRRTSVGVEDNGNDRGDGGVHENDHCDGWANGIDDRRTDDDERVGNVLRSGRSDDEHDEEEEDEGEEDAPRKGATDRRLMEAMS